MAQGTTISQATPITTLDGSELLPAVKTGVPKGKITLAAIMAYLGQDLDGGNEDTTFDPYADLDIDGGEV